MWRPDPISLQKQAQTDEGGEPCLNINILVENVERPTFTCMPESFRQTKKYDFFQM